ncbi:MAG TPA: hypothetical protein VK463_11765 [Desulfomonilaceae bacterium]|nr:hypothetical protein [Desulfomonilaceae bacterium]
MKRAMIMATKLKVPLAVDFGHGDVIAPLERRAIVNRVKEVLRGGVYELF